MPRATQRRCVLQPAASLQIRFQIFPWLKASGWQFRLEIIDRTGEV
jgi:hypothetical protein